MNKTYADSSVGCDEQFTSEFHTAQNNEKRSFQALDAHWKSNPFQWMFWKRPDPEWKQKEEKLINDYKEACFALNAVKEKQNPGRNQSRSNALMFCGFFAAISLLGAIFLAVINASGNDQSGWFPTLSTLMMSCGAGAALMCFFVFIDE